MSALAGGVALPPELPPEFLPYAERLYSRFPEILLALGHPSLSPGLHAPPAGRCGSLVEISECAGQKRVRVSLGSQLPAGESWPPSFQQGVREALPLGEVAAAGARGGSPIRVIQAPAGRGLSPDGALGAARGLSPEGRAQPCTLATSSLRRPGKKSRPGTKISIDLPADSSCESSESTSPSFGPSLVPRGLSPAGSGGDEPFEGFDIPAHQRVAQIFLPIKRRMSDPLDAGDGRDVKSNDSSSPSRTGTEACVVHRPKVGDQSIMNSKVRSLSSAGSGPGSPGSSESGSPSRCSGSPSRHSATTQGSESPMGRPRSMSSLRLRRGLDLTLKPPTLTSMAEGGTDHLSPNGTTHTKRTKQKKGLKPKKFPGGLSCSSPEHRSRSVLLLNESSRPKRLSQPEPTYLKHRLMPGAFPNQRTVFFFDWDDTLCPTTWIRRILKDHIADSQQWAEDFTGTCEIDWLESIPSWFTQPLPDEPSFHESIADLQQAVIDVIDLAQAFGVVCIVTNAVPGWVEKTIKKWLPKLTPYISGHGFRPPIRVLYGQQHYAELTGDNELPPVNNRGPLMWWKKGAMQLALDEVEQLYRIEQHIRPGEAISWCTSGQSKLIDTVISIGDNEAEMEASELCGCVCNDRRLRRVQAHNAGDDVYWRLPQRATSAPPGDCSRPHNPWVKLVKLKEWPHVRTLCMQLEEMHDILPHLVSMRKHFRIDLARQDPSSPLMPHQDPTSPLMPRSSADLRSHLLCAETEAELRMDHALRTQTV